MGFPVKIISSGGSAQFQASKNFGMLLFSYVFLIGCSPRFLTALFRQKFRQLCLLQGLETSETFTTRIAQTFFKEPLKIWKTWLMLQHN